MKCRGILTEAALRFVSFYCSNVAGWNNKKHYLPRYQSHKNRLKENRFEIAKTYWRIHLVFVSDFNFKVCLATCNAMQVWQEKHKQTSAHMFLCLFSCLFREKILIFNILTLCQHRYLIYMYIEFWVSQP